ncbi:MAG: acyl-CoA thioester hydrolase [Pirellulaceae bacterium]|jgi:acyl-CoA thioester hydrolase
MPAIYEHKLTVTPDHIDRLGHVNNLEYLRWMIDAAVAHSAAQGWNAERYLEIGATWVVRSHAIQYLESAMEGDEIIVRTWVSNFQKIRSLRKYKIVRARDDAPLAKAETSWVFLALEARVPRQIAAEVEESFIVVPPEEEP